MVRVLIADDSAQVRAALALVLGADPEITVVGVAADGEEAVAKTLTLRPDVVSMDLRMPRLDGVGAIRAIMDRRPTPIVVLYANSDPHHHELGLRALTAGALEVVQKSALATPEDIRSFRASFGSVLKLMSEVKVIRIHKGFFATGSRGAPDGPPPHGPVAVVGICASTGGPTALEALLACVPAGFPAPICVVQHITEGFLGGLVEWLAATSAVAVKVAEDGERAVAGTAYFAPEGLHLVVDSESILRLIVGDPIRGHLPSGDVLFRSLAASFQERAMGVVLTGMGEDGAEGAGAISAVGGVVIAQDEESCVVYGMPRAVVENGAASEVLSLEAIAPRMAYWARAGNPPDGAPDA